MRPQEELASYDYLLATHKYASHFIRPISNVIAPRYNTAIKKPINLSVVKKKIKAGLIRTTSELHRDLLLMLSNALMYNSTASHIHNLARVLHDEVRSEIKILISAERHAASLANLSPVNRKMRLRRTIAEPQPVTKKMKTELIDDYDHFLNKSTPVVLVENCVAVNSQKKTHKPNLNSKSVNQNDIKPKICLNPMRKIIKNEKFATPNMGKILLGSKISNSTLSSCSITTCNNKNIQQNVLCAEAKNFDVEIGNKVKSRRVSENVAGVEKITDKAAVAKSASESIVSKFNSTKRQPDSTVYLIETAFKRTLNVELKNSATKTEDTRKDMLRIDNERETPEVFNTSSVSGVPKKESTKIQASKVCRKDTFLEQTSDIELKSDVLRKISKSEIDLSVAITTEPKRDLTKEQANEVKKSLVDKIIALALDCNTTFAPNFREKPVITDGVIKLWCENERSLEWLKKTVKEIKFEYGDLIVKKQVDLPWKVKSAILIPDCLSGTEVIQSLLRVQNLWADVASWVLYSAEQQRDDMYLVFGIPSTIIPLIMARDRRLAYSLGSVYVKFFKGTVLSDEPPVIY